MGLGAEQDFSALARGRVERDADLAFSATRKLTELEQIVRGLAAADPFAGGSVNCVYCGLTTDAHDDGCVWLVSMTWVARNLP
jgi:hypothetical protein